MKPLRQKIEIKSDYDFNEYLLETSIIPEQVDRLNSIIKNHGYDYSSLHCGCSYDCCGCFCGHMAEAVVLFGMVYIAVRTRFNY